MIGLPTTVTPESLRASGSLFEPSRRISTRIVPVAVAPNPSATTYSSSTVPSGLVGSGVNVTWPVGSNVTAPEARGHRVEHERVAVGIAVVEQHVERRRRAGARLGDVGDGDRRLVVGAVVVDATSTVTCAEAVPPRPSVIV